GQPVQPQAGAGARGNRGSGLPAAVLAAVQPGPQPDRAGVRQAQGAAAEGGGADGRRAVGVPGRCLGPVRPGGVPKLFQALWLLRYTKTENALAVSCSRVWSRGSRGTSSSLGPVVSSLAAARASGVAASCGGATWLPRHHTTASPTATARAPA